jgi:tRNA A-37 threonylcarbamoyl transferase component Bud32
VNAIETSEPSFEERPSLAPALIFQRLTERIDPEMLRVAGRVRQWAASVFIVISIFTSVTARSMHLDEEFCWRFTLCDLPMLATILVLGALLSHGNFSLPRMRQMNTASQLVEMASIFLSLWAYGTANSFMLAVAALWAVTYRVTLDSRAGLIAVCGMLIGQWCMVSAEVMDLIPMQPITLDPPRGYERMAARQFTALLNSSVMLICTYVLAHWTKLRLLDRERTTRVLRRALAQRFPGEIGPETGRVLQGVFAVGALLGRGGMGEVYEATDTRNDEQVALKMLHPHLAQQSRSLRRFRREAAILASLGSPHIVQLRSVEEDEGRPFIVLELLRGETLDQRLKRTGPLRFESVIRLAEQLADALSAAHAHGVIHRDLNPANVFLCGDPAQFVAKVFDFGVSKLNDGQTQLTVDGGLLGTPAFMAPEQAMGRSEQIGPSTDVYSMALVLYVALTGREPFPDMPLHELLMKISSSSPRAPSSIRVGVNGSVDAAFARATAHDPSQRFASANEFARALGQALDRQTLDVPDSRSRRIG